MQLYSRLLPQLPELPPSTLASLSRCLLAWEAAPAERWLAGYWRALEAASGDMYAEGILQVVSAVVLRGMRPSVALLQKLALAAERMLAECSPETQVGLRYIHCWRDVRCTCTCLRCNELAHAANSSWVRGQAVHCAALLPGAACS